MKAKVRVLTKQNEPRRLKWLYCCLVVLFYSNQWRSCTITTQNPSCLLIILYRIITNIISVWHFDQIVQPLSNVKSKLVLKPNSKVWRLFKCQDCGYSMTSEFIYFSVLSLFLWTTTAEQQLSSTLGSRCRMAGCPDTSPTDSTFRDYAATAQGRYWYTSDWFSSVCLCPALLAI